MIEAIAAGRRAAISIDTCLGGDGTLEFEKRNAECGNGQSYDSRRESGFAELKRIEVPSLPLSGRISGFAEVKLCINDEQAFEEIHRCLQYDLEICLLKNNRESQTN